jgi:hypothetical protein
MKRRWLQFSLRTAFVAMLLAGVGIGAFIKWPYSYYRAREKIEAAGHFSSKTWPFACEAFARDKAVQRFVLSGEEFRLDSIPYKDGVCYELSNKTDLCWVVYVNWRNNAWVTTTVQYNPRSE